MRRYQLIPSHAVQTLLITSVSPLPSGEIGAPYSFTFNAIGGVAPYSWSEVGAIPSGLTFSGGTLSGTPTGTFSSSFNVTVTDSVGSQFTRAFSLTVITAVQITTASPLPGGTVGVAYSTTIAATGGATPYSWSILGFTGANSYSINSVTGVLTGTLGVAEIDSINIQVVDALGIPSAKNFNLTVIPAASLTITTSSPLPAATQSSAYSTTMAATGGTPPYTWSLTSHTGTNTWSVSSGGLVSGTPANLETDSLVIKVTDSVLATASGTFSLTVSAPVSGFLPAGHWVPAKQAMIQVYPRPDSETNTFARHRWAYYDGIHSVAYNIPLGVAFGAFPYVYQLISGPPGMSIGTTGWNTSWGTGSNPAFTDARNAGYGVLQWTPTGSVSGATVQVLVTDQQMNTLTITFTVSTSSATSHFIFVDSVHGNDSTGTGTISAPWASFAKSFGTLTSPVNPGAICYFRSGTYTFAATRNDQGTNLYEFNTSTQPSAMIGFPGDTAPVVTMTTGCFCVLTSGFDLFVQGMNPNNYDVGSSNARFYWVRGGATSAGRTTFDTNIWSNSGYGSSGSNNADGYYIDTTDSVTNYHFINSCAETNRHAGNTGNNYVGCSFYSVNNSLVQGCYFLSPTWVGDEAWQPKSNLQNSTWRGNTTIVSALQFAYSPLQSVSSNPGTMGSVEICYNILVGGGEIAMPVAATGQNYGSLWCYRNNVQGSTAISGLTCNGQGVGGPYVFENNAVQGNSALPSGTGVTTANNILATSGVINTSNGNLTATYSSFVGTVGAQIA